MKSEDLAHWYFRLNGFFTLPNFVLHPREKGGQRTDVDVAGIRFPGRREFATGNGEIDDPEFSKSGDRLYAVFAEIKTSRASPNRAWLDPNRRNLDDLLGALGIFGAPECGLAAEGLRTSGTYENGMIYCSLFLIGETLEDVGAGLALVPHRTWDALLRFIYRRFVNYDHLKTDTEQWDEAGRALLGFMGKRSESAFISAARRAFHLPIC